MGAATAIRPDEFFDHTPSMSYMTALMIMMPVLWRKSPNGLCNWNTASKGQSWEVPFQFHVTLDPSLVRSHIGGGAMSDSKFVSLIVNDVIVSDCKNEHQ